MEPQSHALSLSSKYICHVKNGGRRPNGTSYVCTCTLMSQVVRTLRCVLQGCVHHANTIKQCMIAMAPFGAIHVVCAACGRLVQLLHVYSVYYAYICHYLHDGIESG